MRRSQFHFGIQFFTRNFLHFINYSLSPHSEFQFQKDFAILLDFVYIWLWLLDHVIHRPANQKRVRGASALLFRLPTAQISMAQMATDGPAHCCTARWSGTGLRASQPGRCHTCPRWPAPRPRRGRRALPPTWRCRAHSCPASQTQYLFWILEFPFSNKFYQSAFYYPGTLEDVQCPCYHPYS